MMGGINTGDCESITFKKDHYSICKFASKDDPDYIQLLGSLRQMLEILQRADAGQGTTRKQHRKSEPTHCAIPICFPY